MGMPDLHPDSAMQIPDKTSSTTDAEKGEHVPEVGGEAGSNEKLLRKTLKDEGPTTPKQKQKNIRLKCKCGWVNDPARVYQTKRCQNCGIALREVLIKNPGLWASPRMFRNMLSSRSSNSDRSQHGRQQIDDIDESVTNVTLSVKEPSSELEFDVGKERLTFAVFGYTGMVGRTFVQAAQRCGHNTRVLATDPMKVLPGPGLSVHQGSPTEKESVSKMLNGADIAVVSFGDLPNDGPQTDASVGIPMIMAAAARSSNCRRVIIVRCVIQSAKNRGGVLSCCTSAPEEFDYSTAHKNHLVTTVVIETRKVSMRGGSAQVSIDDSQTRRGTWANPSTPCADVVHAIKEISFTEKYDGLKVSINEPAAKQQRRSESGSSDGSFKPPAYESAIGLNLTSES